MVLLISPPVVKPGEAPAGLALLAGAHGQAALPHAVVDASLEGLFYLMENGPQDSDTWGRRARRCRDLHLADLRSPRGYLSIDRYRRAVADLSRLVHRAAAAWGVRLSLTDYEDPRLSPVRSADLIQAAEKPETNAFFPYFRDRLPGVLEETNPSVVGVSLNYLSQALCAFAMMGFLRQAAPGLRIVLGGSLVTSWSKRLGGANPFVGIVDDLIAGPGEGPVLAMANRPLPATPVCPDYAAFPRERYLAPGWILPYSASRGCWWRRCTFCPETAEGNPYGPRSPGRVLRDLDTLNSKTPATLVHLLDNALSPALLSALAERGAGPPWYGFARITEQLARRDFCEALRRSGCVMLQLGLESGSQAVLDALRKGVNLATAAAVLKNLKAAGIGTYVYVLFGTPAEGPEEAAATLDFVVRHGEHIDFLNTAVFNLPVDAGEEVPARPFYEADLSLYRDFSHPRGWDRRRIRGFLDRTFKRHPAVLPIIGRDPPAFTSNHAAFFLGHGL
jgi:hypothetical protein